jgi:UPF0716 family protein affecting phage T7 exclusion
MTTPRKPRPTILQGLTLTVAGMAVLLYGVNGSIAGMNSVSDPTPLGPLMAMFGGGLVFAIGAMLLLVAVVRPLFAKRPADERAERPR